MANQLLLRAAKYSAALPLKQHKYIDPNATLYNVITTTEYHL